ncbi:hypothetical protein TWF481_006348 [Arthrobotrys musiformis]|uniref:Apple domain-containing protein n=1 Tax=Arthrobotrys musiformis TaxID=47236 RepID=A0AAV9WGH5_9PEZI
MKFHGAFTTFTAFIGLVHALSATTPSKRDLTTEDILNLAEGHLPPGFNSNLEKRNKCHPDNVLRLFRDKRHSRSASAFCSKFIQSTITQTVLVRGTITTQTIKTPPPTSVTVTEVFTLTETDTTSSTTYIPTTAVLAPNIIKRSKEAYPSWLPSNYPPSRISSACSCHIKGPCAVRVTKTITTGIKTVFSKTITLAPVTSTVTESATTLTTVTSIVPIPKVITCKANPACRRPGSDVIDFLSGYTHEQCKKQCADTDGCLSTQYGFTGGVEGVCVLGRLSVADTYEPGISATSPICLWWYMDDVDCVYVD